MQENLELSFTVPGLVPVSVNHYKTPGWFRKRDGSIRLGFYLTRDAKAYRDAVAIFAQGRSVVPETERERVRVKYAVRVDVYLGKRQRLDADNAGKVCLDALQNCGVIHSDAYVIECKLNLHKEDRQHPRTEFLVRRM